MVAIFCRVSAELAPDFIGNFPRQFDFNGMLTKICDDIDVDISFQNETYLLQGDWNSLGRAYNMLVSTLAVYGNASSVCNELVTTAAKGSRPFSALVEAAEAISRGVELQEQVQNEMSQMKKVSHYTSIPHFPIAYSDHQYDRDNDNEYDRASKYSQNSLDEQESTSECSIHDSGERLNEQKAIEFPDAPECQQESQPDCQVYKDPVTATVIKPEFESSMHESADRLNEQKAAQYPDASKCQQESHVYKDPVLATVIKPEFELSASVHSRQQSFDSVKSGAVLLTEDHIQDRSKECIPLTISPDNSIKKNISGEEICEINASLKKSFNCLNCDFKTNSETSLSEHRSQFHQSPMAKCDICEKIFINVRYMKRHRSCHKDVYHNCTECGKSYKVLKALKEHQKTHDKNYVKPEFKCEICTKSFCSIYLKECHVKSEHLGLKKTFLCQTCGKSFTTKHTLQQHVNAHTGIRPYQCSECGKCFTYEAALRDHKFTHVESKTFVCEYPECKKAFRQRSALKMHEKIHKNPNQFECSECGRGFTQKQALQRHIRSHKGLKPFRCKYCGRTFGDASIIRRHMKLVHKLNKDIDKWREDIIEESVEQQTVDKEILTSDSSETLVNQETAMADVTLLPSDETKDNPYKQASETIRQDMKESSIQNGESNTDSELNTSHIQSVFVSYNVPGQNLVLANTSATDFSQTTTPLIQYHFKQAEEVETGSNSTEKTDIETVNSIPETVHDQMLQQESETACIEREQIQFLTENLDGTFNTTVNFSKLKRNLELLTKPNATVDLNLASDATSAETLKPDGTVAEMPLNSGLENITRCGDIETLSDNLGLSLSQCQYYYYNLGNQYLNVNQNQLNTSLNASDASTDGTIP